MIRTPNNLEILMHFYVSPSIHPRYDAPAVREGVQYLIDHGMLFEGELYCTVTPKGEFFIKHLMDIPFPVETYRIPD